MSQMFHGPLKVEIHRSTFSTDGFQSPLLSNNPKILNNCLICLSSAPVAFSQEKNKPHYLPFLQFCSPSRQSFILDFTILLKSFWKADCYFFWCTLARVSITDFACPKKMMCHDWVSLFCQHAMTEGDKILTPARCPMSRFLSIWVLANTGKFIKHVTCRQKSILRMISW